MRWGHTEVFVSDPLRARNFYVDVLGFELQKVEEDEFVWLRKDGAVLLLRPGRGVGRFQSYQASPSAFVLYTDDLDRSVAELESKGLEFQGTDGSDRCPTFTDPDGNWFQLVDPGER